MKYARLAWFGSVALMLGALFFQYVLNMAPCVLCIYQRIPHIIVIVIGAILIWKNYYKLFPLMGLIILIGSGIAFFHVGVEQGWWEGLQSCSGQTELNLDDLLAKPPARCDEVPWSLFGLSMAGWNGLISLAIAVCWFLGYREERA